jgi:hypothetical protein
MWYYLSNFDWRRLRRELAELSREDSTVLLLWRAVARKGGGKLQQFALADRVEELGRPVLAKMVREYMEATPDRDREMEEGMIKRSGSPTYKELLGPDMYEQFRKEKSEKKRR